MRFFTVILVLCSVGAAPVEEELRKLLAEDKSDPRRLIELATQRESEKLHQLDPDTMRWLSEREKLAPLFLLALAPEDDARRALGILSSLNREFGAKLGGHEELAVALAVVWDAPAAEGQTEAQCQTTACALFAHLTGRKLRLDSRDLPWPVLVYLVNASATDDDRQWATTAYRLPTIPGKAYFDVKYDMTGFRTGQWKGGHDVPYSLANLKRLGGVCKDQAHFAAETMRANGIPATVCTGQAARAGGFHAWVGHLVQSGQSYAWDFRTARYPEHGYWSGSVTHPQTGRKLSDRDVAMSAEWCNSPPDERLFSLAVTRSLGLVADDARRLRWAMRAVDAAPGNDEAWFAVVAECAKPATDRKTLNQVMDVVDQFAGGRYDDFAFRILTKLAAGRPLDEQLNILDRARTLFQRRPDLRAELQLHQGDALRKAGKTNEALQVYTRLLEQAGAYGSVALETLERMEQVLHAKEARRLAHAYLSAWNRIRAPEASGYAHTTPWYLIGDRYAELLEELGDADAAAKVRQALDRKDTAVK